VQRSDGCSVGGYDSHANAVRSGDAPEFRGSQRHELLAFTDHRHRRLRKGCRSFSGSSDWKR